MTKNIGSELTVRAICRKAIKKYSAEEKTRIVLEGFRDENNIKKEDKKDVVSLTGTS